MSTDDLWLLDATELAARIRRRELSSVECVTACAERIERLDWVNAFASTRLDQAVSDARAADDVSMRGESELPPLHGVPFAVKDWKCTSRGEPMWWGTRLLRDIDHRADVTSELAARYERAGLISLGRTNLPELAFGPPTTEPDANGVTRNPWDRTRSVGGSSGGSAAAVAAGLVPLANASDGGGSLRIPAACCGLVGLKVSRGRLTNAPHADGRNIKVEGHLARSVRDIALLLDLTAGPADGDVDGLGRSEHGSFVVAASTSLRPLRIGVMVDPPGCMNPNGSVPASARQAVERVAAHLADHGHHVEAAFPPGLAIPLSTPNLYAAERAVLRSRIASLIGREVTIDDVEPRTWTMFQLAERADGIAVLNEIDNEQRWARTARAWWDTGWDLLLTPALGRDVPVLGELKETADDPLGASMRGYPMAWFSYPFNVTGQPAITVPVPVGGEALCDSVQFVAPIGREDLLLCVAAHLETELALRDRVPAAVR
jgi:amidase